MELSIFGSDSDESDMELLELLFMLSEMDTDSDDADEEIRRRASSRSMTRVNYMQSLDDADFTFRFRLTKPAVQSLLNKLLPFVRDTSTRNNGVSPLHQLLLTLRFYALGTTLKSIADFIGVSASTAGRIVHDISSAIAKLYDQYILVHQQSADKFYQIGGFPRVLAAIDCTHIRLQSPFLNGEEFRNRKGYFSLHVQAICDADLRFMNVVARWAGSAHKATIFNNSNLRVQCEAGQFGNLRMLGDSAYPNRQYLLTPLLNPVTVAEQHYNEAHIKTRKTIERTFEVWKRRFPVMALSLRFSLPKVNAVIIATAVLHNFCRDYNLEEVPPEVEMPAADVIEDLENSDVQDVKERETLINHYFG